jgi:hypothetical protein
MGLCDFCKPFRQHLSNLSVILLSRALGWDWTGVAGVAERTTFLVRGAPVRLRPLAGAAGAPVFSEVPHSPQNLILSGFSVPQLVQRMLPLYSFGVSGTRKPPDPKSGGNLLPSAGSLQHTIDILRTGIDGWEQLCPLQSPEGRLGHL